MKIVRQEMIKLGCYERFPGKLNECLCKITYHCSVCAHMRTHIHILELMSLWQGGLQKLQVFLVETKSQFSSAACDFLFL